MYPRIITRTPWYKTLFRKVEAVAPRPSWPWDRDGSDDSFMAFLVSGCGLDLLSGSSLREMGLHRHFQLAYMYALPH